MSEGFRVVRERRFAASPDLELPLAPGCRRRWGSTRLVAADPQDVVVAADRVVVAGARELRVHDRATGALRAWFQLEGRLGVLALDAAGRRAWLVGWQERPTEIPGIGPATLATPCAAALDLEAGVLTTLAGPVPANPRHVAVDPEARYLAIAPPDGAIHVLALPGGEPVGEARLAYPLDRVGFSADGRRLEAVASGNPNPFAELSDRTPWRVARGSWGLPGLVGEVEDEAFRDADRVRRTPADRRLAALRAELVPPVATGDDPPAWVQGAPGGAPTAAAGPWPGDDPPAVVAALPDGHHLAGGYPDGSLRLADLRTGAVGDPVDGDPGAIRALHVSPDGETLAVVTRAGAVLAWDLPELLQRAGTTGPGIGA